MKTELFLDHQTILANQARPIHFAVRFQADKSEANARPAGAFCVVLDRSGSMEGEPLAHAREATKTAIKNLRPEDQFSLVVFDDTARVIVSLQPAVNRSKWGQAVDHIVTGGSTNLTGGWMLGREELAKVPAGLNRRLLLLTDGQLNVGIVDPVEVQGIVASGRERDGVRTACLGFGEDYDENLLGSLARCSNGELYDAESSETFPAIFARELEGLQALTVQNLRVRLKRLDFCENIFALNDYPFVKLPDGRIVNGG